MRKVVIVVGIVFAGLGALCMTCMVAGLVAAPEQGSPTSEPSRSGELTGRYDCTMASTVMMNGMLTPQYNPTGLSFTIDGDSYDSSTGGGGTITFDAETVTFSGGGFDGWRGARGTDTIIFRKEHGDPRPGVNVQFGDFRCGKR